MPTGKPLVLPQGDESYLVFREGRMDVYRGREHSGHDISTLNGKPAAAGVDRNTLWAAVAYDRAFAAFPLAEPQPTWNSAAWPAPPGVVAVAGERATVTSGDLVLVFDVTEPDKPIWQQDTRVWLDKMGVDYLHYAVSLSADRLVLAGYDATTFGGKVVLLDVPVNEGGENIQVIPVAGLSQLHRCTSDGMTIYLAGTRERQRQQTVSQTMAPLVIDLRVYAFDPVNRGVKNVLDRADHDESLIVTDLVVGPEAVAVVYSDRLLKIYSHGGAELLVRQFDEPVSVAWTSSDQFAVSSSGEPVLLTLP